MSTTKGIAHSVPTDQQSTSTTLPFKHWRNPDQTDDSKKQSYGGGLPSLSSQERPLTSSSNGFEVENTFPPFKKTSSSGSPTVTSSTLTSTPQTFAILPLRSEALLPPRFLTAKQLLEAEGREEKRILAPAPTISFGCTHTGDKADTSDVSPRFHLCKHCELWFCNACMPKHRMTLLQAFCRKEKNTRDDELIDLLYSFF